MHDLIDRQAAQEELDKIVKDYIADKSFQCNFAAGVVCDVRDNVIAELPAVDAVVVGFCDGCIYSNGKRQQKCSCCRRNRYLKDCYKEGV